MRTTKLFVTIIFGCLLPWCGLSQELMIAKKSVWKYHDFGQNLGETWRGVSFSDDHWSAGPGILGYGESDLGTQLAYGDNPTNKHITTYFRKSFEVAGAADYTKLLISLLRDDGAVVYLNGHFLFSSNMPEDYDFNTYALEGVGLDEERTYFDFILNADFLLEGENVLAVEVHQIDPSSSDLSFDLEMWISDEEIGHIRINEVCPRNVSNYLDPDDNQFQDWFELYNPSAYPMDLGGHYLTDNYNVPDKWRIPDGTIIASEGYLVISADGLNKKLHTNFRLSGAGEKLVLSSPDLQVIDSLTFPSIYPDETYGIMDGGARGYFHQPTPGMANATGYSSNARATDPLFSLDPGFYNSTINLELTSSLPDSEIRYTLDGRDPDVTSATYSSPIQISSNTVVRAKVYAPGILPSQTIVQSYFIGRDHDLPVFSIATDPDFLYDYDVGIYRDDRLPERKPWDRPGSMEFFVNDNREFIQNIDFRLFGRGAIYFPQKSLAIFLRLTKGYDGLNYSLFPNAPVTHFQSFLLRSSSDDWRNTMFRDGMIHSLLVDQMDLEFQDYRPAVLYINGDYFGIHNIRDKLNEWYLATHQGADPEQVDLLFVDNDYSPPEVEIKAGDDRAYWAMYNFVVQSDMTNEDNYLKASELIDLENYQDYCAVQIVAGNRSWLHNRRVWRPNTPDGKFRYMLFDLDYGYMYLEENILNSLRSKDMVFKSLMNNPDFKAGLIQKLALYAQTIFDRQRVDQIIDKLAAAIDSEIPAHAERWGPTFTNNFKNKGDWEDRVDVMRNYNDNRASQHESYIQSYLGNPGRIDVSVSSLPIGSGKIFLYGSELPENGFAGYLYDNQSVVLKAETLPGARFTGWTGTDLLTHLADDQEWQIVDGRVMDEEIRIKGSADFTIQATFNDPKESEVLITELFYLPDNNQGGDQGEFIEIRNTGSQVVDLSGAQFSNAISYTFPANTSLNPGEIILLAKTPDLYDHLSVQIFQWTDGRLSDTGEDLQFKNADGDWIDRVNYSIHSPWPVAASGYSIELCSSDTDNNVGSNWKISASRGGSPGAFKNEYCPILVLNEVVGRNTKQDYLGNTDWIELFNPGSSTIDLAGLYISDDPTNPLKYRVPEGFSQLTQIKPGEYKVLQADGSAEVGPLHMNFRISGSAGYIGLFYQNSDGSFTTVDDLNYGGLPEKKSMARIPDGRGDFILTEPSPGSTNLKPVFEIVAPEVVSAGDLLPVVVRVTNDLGQIDKSIIKTLQLSSSSGVLNPSEIKIRNGVGSASVFFTAEDDFELSVSDYDYSRHIKVRSLPVVKIAGTIDEQMVLVSGVTYEIDQSITVATDGELIVNQGARLLMGRKANIHVNGHLEFNGSLNRPIVIMPKDPDNPWGGIDIKDRTDTVKIAYTFMVNGGYDSAKLIGHSYSQPVIRTKNVLLSIDNLYSFDHTGKGLFSQFSKVFVRNSLFSRLDTGPELEFSLGQFWNTWFIDVPDDDWSVIDDDNDALYFQGVHANDSRPNLVDGCVIYKTEDDGIDISGTRLLVKNTWFSRNYDKGISGGWRSDLRVERCFFYRNHTGVSSTFWTPVVVDHCTFYKNVRAVHSISGGGIVENSILYDHSTEYSEEGENVWLFNYTLSDTDQELPGKGNVYGNPDFNDTDDLDFSLSAGSLAIDAGDPAYRKDADGSITDVGFLPFGFGMTGDHALLISEIHYNPVAPSGISEQYEFIEMIHAGSQDLDVSGFWIADAIEFSFPAGTILSPGEIILLAMEKQTYADRGVRVFDWNSGKLSNSGEVISLYNVRGDLIDQVTYGDATPWPMAADGTGFSLELTSLSGDNSDAGQWQASQVWGGTPGLPYQPIDFNKIKLNEFMRSGDENLYPWIEIYNENLHGFDLTGTRIRNSRGQQFVLQPNHHRILPGVSGFLSIHLDPRVIGSGGLFELAFGDQLILERFDGSNWVTIDQLSLPEFAENKSYGRYPDGSADMTEFMLATPGLPNSMGSSRIITTRSIVPGDDVPVVVRLESEQGNPFYLLQNEVSVSANLDFTDQVISLVNGQGGMVSRVNESESFLLRFNEIDDTLGIAVSASRHRFYVDKKLNFDQVWTAEHEYYIDHDLEIPAGVKLTIEQGTRVFLERNNKMIVDGKLEINGTIQYPVVFNSWDPDEPWGNIEFSQFSGGGSLQGVFFINGGGDTNDISGYSDSQAILESAGASLELNNCFFIDNPGKALYAYGGNISVSNSMVSETESGFIVKEGTLTVDKTWLQFIPDKEAAYDQEEHDGIFISGSASGGTAVISNSSFGHISDDAITAFKASAIDVSHSYFRYIGDKAATLTETPANLSYLLIIHSDEGISLRGNEPGIVDHVTLYDNNVHVKSFATSDGSGYGDLRIQNSILGAAGTANYYTDDVSDLRFRYSLADNELFDGTGNLFADPAFIHVIGDDFRLSSGSPAIDAGDPDSPPDNDGSRTDIGAYTGSEIAETSGIIINEIMYAPKTTAEHSEFIELYNLSNQGIDLSGYFFSSGINFTFPAGISIAPGEYLVLTDRLTTYSGQGYPVFQWQSGDLSNTGETIALMDAEGMSVNQVTYSAGQGWPERSVDTDLSIELIDPALSNYTPGNWRSSYVTGGTPGRKNSSPGTEGLVLNEFMARNTETISDETGNFVDWLEIYNTSEQFVTLNGLYISGDPQNLRQYQITGNEDDLLLAPGEYQLVWLDNMPEKGVFHTNFELAGAEGFIALSRSDGSGVVSFNSASYSGLGADIAYGRYPNGSGEFTTLYIPTPGGSNDVGASPIIGLKINELLARNSGVGYRNDIGEYDDWIELYNHTGAPIDVAGLYFSDDLTNPLKWRIPFGHSFETTVAPFDFLMLFPSAKTESGPRHLDFQLAGGGEDVVITQILQDGQHTIDQITYPALGADISYGRSYDGYDQWQIFSIPTPNASNGYNAVLQIDQELRLEVFPNPVSERLHIQFSYPEAFDYEIDILTLLSSRFRTLDAGTQMPAYTPVSRSYSLQELSNQSSAYAIIRLRINDRFFTQKIILLHD